MNDQTQLAAECWTKMCAPHEGEYTDAMAIADIRTAIEKALSEDRRGDCHLCNLPFTNLVEHYAAAHPKSRAAHASEGETDAKAALKLCRKILAKSDNPMHVEAVALIDIALPPLNTQPAHASEQGADTKRLDFALEQCREVNRTVKHGNFYLPETREGIDAAMSQRATTEK